MDCPKLRTKLTVVPDNSAPGSEGRLCLQLPKLEPGIPELWVGTTWRSVGHLATDLHLLLIADPEGYTVTPRRQLWWKNGVRDHGIRENWWVDVYILDLTGLMVVQLHETTDEPTPKLPPYQPSVFT